MPHCLTLHQLQTKWKLFSIKTSTTLIYKLRKETYIRKHLFPYGDNYLHFPQSQIG